MTVETHWNYRSTQGDREFEGLNASSILDMAAERWVLDGANPFSTAELQSAGDEGALVSTRNNARTVLAAEAWPERP